MEVLAGDAVSATIRKGGIPSERGSVTGQDVFKTGWRFEPGGGRGGRAIRRETRQKWYGSMFSNRWDCLAIFGPCLRLKHSKKRHVYHTVLRLGHTSGGGAVRERNHWPASFVCRLVTV